MKINLPITGRPVDFAPDANILSTTDLNSAITYANPDFIKVSGYELNELLGSPHIFCVIPTCRQRLLPTCGKRSSRVVRGWGW